MSSHLAPIDPDDPRAPPADVWARLSPEERARVVASLPAEIPESLWMPEGDRHSAPKLTAFDVLRRYFGRLGRRVYVSGELAVYYPGEARFSPDVLAVLDVDLHPRDKWVVSEEGRGLDFVLEIHAHGDRHKDFVRNVAWYARLGIGEYFVFDVGRELIVGHRLTSDGVYARIVPQGGRFVSETLGIDLLLEGGRLGFAPRAGSALLESSALFKHFEAIIDEAQTSKAAIGAELEAERQAREAAEAEREAERQAREAAVAERDVERQAREAAVAEREAEREAREAERQAAELEIGRLRQLLAERDRG